MNATENVRGINFRLTKSSPEQLGVSQDASPASRVNSYVSTRVSLRGLLLLRFRFPTFPLSRPPAKLQPLKKRVEYISRKQTAILISLLLHIL